MAVGKVLRREQNLPVYKTPQEFLAAFLINAHRVPYLVHSVTYAPVTGTRKRSAIPGLHLIIGEASVGKSHAMRAMYELDDPSVTSWLTVDEPEGMTRWAPSSTAVYIDSISSLVFTATAGNTARGGIDMHLPFRLTRIDLHAKSENVSIIASLNLTFEGMTEMLGTLLTGRVTSVTLIDRAGMRLLRDRSAEKDKQARSAHLQQALTELIADREIVEREVKMAWNIFLDDATTEE